MVPEPLNALLFAGGAGLLGATALAARGRGRRSAPIGIIGALPGVPIERPGKSTISGGGPAEEEMLRRRYDKAFNEMLARQSAKSRSYILEQMKPIVYQLSPDIKAWTGDTRIRMHLLLKELSRDLDDPASARQSLDMLVLILSKGGSSAVEMARPMFREKIQEMYDRSHQQSDRLLPRLLLMLDDYDPRAVETLTKDAIYVWGDDRFRAASEFLGLETLRERGLRSRLKGVLGGEIARAGNDGDVIALCRAMDLYQAVR